MVSIVMFLGQQQLYIIDIALVYKCLSLSTFLAIVYGAYPFAQLSGYVGAVFRVYPQHLLIAWCLIYPWDGQVSESMFLFSTYTFNSFRFHDSSLFFVSGCQGSDPGSMMTILYLEQCRQYVVWPLPPPRGCNIRYIP